MAEECLQKTYLDRAYLCYNLKYKVEIVDQTYQNKHNRLSFSTLILYIS